jgi:hypothetical protein
MRHKALPVWIMGVLLMGGGGCAQPTADTHQGKVVAASAGTLTMTDLAGGSPHGHDVAADATITCSGKPCGLAELKPGFTITVTTAEREGKTLVTKIEAQEASS